MAKPLPVITPETLQYQDVIEFLQQNGGKNLRCEIKDDEYFEDGHSGIGKVSLFSKEEGVFYSGSCFEGERRVYSGDGKMVDDFRVLICDFMKKYVSGLERASAVALRSKRNEIGLD